MKAKVHAIVSAAEALEVLGTKSISVPAKTSFWISKLNAKIKDTVAAYQKARFELIQSLGEKEAGGETIRVKPENIEKYMTEITAIGEQEETVDIAPISVTAFGDAMVPAELFVKLGDFVTE